MLPLRRRLLLDIILSDISLALTATAGQIACLKLTSTDNSKLSIEWGDGSFTVATSGTQYSHVYSSAYTGAVKIKFTGAAKLAQFVIVGSSTVNWTFDVGVFSRHPLTRFEVQDGASNHIFGNLSSIPLATYVSIGGSNTVTGNLSSIPLATYVVINGSNTVTGNLSSIPLATYVAIGGSNTVTFSGSWVGPTTMRQVVVRGADFLSTTVTDALLNALAATVIAWTGEKVVNIHGARTSASDTAVTTLQGLGVAVTVN